ncbi:hypothetical protein ACHAXN_001803, partial [Cyclotella atomus]
HGQILGLLGKNGAGKSTALKILERWVHSYLHLYFARGLGNPPQFDCVWGNQSVQSHSEFYATLKGIDTPEKAALEIATAVGLGDPDVYTPQSGQLSGGMRRRLSIAVSLIGLP